MRRFIMTGAPGSGKTSILRALKNLGYAVVEEASIRRESDGGPITILTRGGR